jgi:predicted RNA-binding protein with PIN domain
MHYLIDGYNLLHHVGLLAGRVGPTGLENARRALLDHLSRRLGPETLRVTVVFDALRAPPTAADALTFNGIQIFFTRCEEADDLIERLIRSASVPRLLTIVSNDRRIRDAARRRQCPVVECVDFWAGLEEAREAIPEAPAGGEEKRDRVSGGETQEWLKEFGDLKDDENFKELFDPYNFDEPS